MTRDIIRNEGIKGMFRGLTPTFAREMPGTKISYLCWKMRQRFICFFTFLGYFFFFGGYELARYYLTPPGKTKDEIGGYCGYRGKLSEVVINGISFHLKNRSLEDNLLWWFWRYLFMGCHIPVWRHKIPRSNREYLGTYAQNDGSNRTYWRYLSLSFLIIACYLTQFVWPSRYHGIIQRPRTDSGPDIPGDGGLVPCLRDQPQAHERFLRQILKTNS